MKLNELLDRNLLTDHVANRLVDMKHHPVLPLRIYNYTHVAQFDPHWGDGTIDYCRGLIVGPDDEIISRPFKKFHNLNTESIPETMEANLPTMHPTITQKLDGSLGIHYAYDGFEGIATRGSFTSAQAQWATANYNARKAARRILSDNPFSSVREISWTPGFTPLFEIIYPENRIVVQYNFADIVLIGMVEIMTGFEMSPTGLRISGGTNNFRVVEELHNIPLDVLKNNNVENEEGYVLSYSNLKTGQPLKVKVKMADYVRLHRVVTGMNARSVWELLKAGEDFKKFETGYPEPFMKWLNKWRVKLNWDYINIVDDAFEVFKDRPVRGDETDREYRKKCALYFMEKTQGKNFLFGLCFMLLDEKKSSEFSEAVWDSIEPRGDDKTFREEGV